MKINSFMIRALLSTILLNALQGTPAMAKESEAFDFSITSLGGLNRGYNYVAAGSTGQIRLGLSDTTGMKYNGVGVIDSRLSPDDIKEIGMLKRRLCDEQKNEIGEDQSSPISFAVTCVDGGNKLVLQGGLGSLSRELAQDIHKFFFKLIETYGDASFPTVKLDVRVSNFERNKDGLTISVMFSNGGEYPIKVPRPDYWDTRKAFSLEVGALRIGGDGELNVQLAGTPISNESNHADQSAEQSEGGSIVYVTIPIRSSRLFKFVVVPTTKLKQGSYDLNANVNLTADALGFGSLGRVNFHSDRSNPTRITLDRDYPSTPQEWKEFESRKAKDVSALSSGAMVAETGYYRMVSVFGPRGPFVRKLDAGEAAPKLDVNNWDKWEWEADLERATVCKPGDACSRDGRWVLRSMDWSPKPEDQTHAQYERRFRTGDTLPTFEVSSVATSKLYWEWLGA